jgi:hypothetical protein
VLSVPSRGFSATRSFKASLMPNRQYFGRRGTRIPPPEWLAILFSEC